MTLADLSIRRPVFAWMLMAFLVVFGTICFSRMGVSQMPDVDFPNVSISIELEGASPEVMESEVVDVIEDAVMSVQGIREVTSTARHGRATVSVEFDLDRDIDVAVQDIQGKLAQSTRLLPRDIDPPVVTKTNPEDQPILWMALSGQRPMQELTQYCRDRLKDQFQTIPGVGEITLGGYLDRNLRIWLRGEELEARELTVEDVLAAVQREHTEIPAGRLETLDREVSVRSVGEIEQIGAFGELIIAFRNNTPIRLSDVAVIEDGLADRRRMARAMGVPSVGMGVRKQRGANAVEVARAVKKKIDEVRKTLPAGMDVAVNFDSTRYVEESIHEIEWTLVLSVILTSLVCWLFLGSWSSTFNILLSIPTSIVGAFIVMYFMGFTLNTFTLLGLSLCVGLVVDDAIMVLENIYRHRERGEERVEAARRGAREITLAAVAATLAIIAIFLPIAFMEGLLGKFLYQFGITITVAVAISLLEALTLTPMRCSQMLSAGGRSTRMGRAVDRAHQHLSAGYRRILSGSLRFRWWVLGGSLAAFVASLMLFGVLRQEIVPPQDQSVFLVRLQTPAGSSIDYTDSKLRQCETFLESRPEVHRYFGVVGGFGGGEVDTGVLFVTMKPPEERPGRISQMEFIEVIRREFNSIPGLRAWPQDLSMRGFSGRGSQFPIQFTITGPDWDVLAQSSHAIMDGMNESKILVDVNSDYIVGLPELRILPDRERAADLGVDMRSIGTTTGAMIGGVRAGQFMEAGRRSDVRLRLVSDERSRPEDISHLFVRNRDGALVRLSQVVTLEERPVLQTITRRNRSRAITISANLAAGRSQGEAMQRIEELARTALPEGYTVDFSGSSQMFREGGFGFLFALGLGVVVAYMVLASQFNSFVHPMLVLLAMPFSISGALLGLWIADASLNLYSMIGMVLLMGIVKKNSILLVEFTNQLREQGKPVREALMEACPIRLRPILMTSLSTIAAAVPAALALGPGAEARLPMAVVVIGGMLLSTLLTLIVVPCAYSVLPGRVAPSLESLDH